MVLKLLLGYCCWGCEGWGCGGWVRADDWARSIILRDVIKELIMIMTLMMKL